MSRKQLFVKIVHATILTVFTAGSVHLAIVGIASVVRSDPSIINPINFLGLQMLFPELGHSSIALFLGWVTLVVLAFLYLFLLIHYKRYIAFISATGPYQKMQRMRQITTELQGVLADLSHMRRHDPARKTLKERISNIIAKYQDD